MHRKKVNIPYTLTILVVSSGVSYLLYLVSMHITRNDILKAIFENLTADTCHPPIKLDTSSILERTTLSV